MIRPSWSFADVLALNALQKSMMLTPCGPSAVPTGGAGVAFPAGSCSRTTALTRFAIVFQTPQNGWLDFLDLEEIQYDWCLTTEKGNKHGNLIAVHIDIADRANKISEWAIDDTHVLPFSKTDFGFRLFGLLGNLLQDCLYLMFLQGNRTCTRT